MQKNIACEVIIVGGGVVGLTLACALAAAKFDVVVVEANKPLTNWDNSHYDLRVSAINRAAQIIFQTLNVWSAMQTLRVSPFRHIHVWDEIGEGSIDFDSTEIGQPYLGHIIENRVLQKTLWQCVDSNSNIKMLCPAQPRSLTLTATQANLTLIDDTQITAKLLVGADGANSWVREQANISLHAWSYQQHALVTTVHTEKAHELTAWQRFLTTGPLALLPLTDPQLCSIVWSTSPEQANQLLALPDNEFNRRLTTAFAAKLGQTNVVDKRVSFPLTMRHAHHYVINRLALVGDAAHTIHPLAGQGVNLGLIDAISLLEVLVAARTKKRDIGSNETLRRYERWRKGENLLMMATVETLKRLFMSQSKIITDVRDLGLKLTSRTPLLKNMFIRRAMGLSGDLPKLIQNAPKFL